MIKGPLLSRAKRRTIYLQKSITLGDQVFVDGIPKAQLEEVEVMRQCVETQIKCSESLCRAEAVADALPEAIPCGGPGAADRGARGGGGDELHLHLEEAARPQSPRGRRTVAYPPFPGAAAPTSLHSCFLGCCGESCPRLCGGALSCAPVGGGPAATYMGPWAGDETRAAEAPYKSEAPRDRSYACDESSHDGPYRSRCGAPALLAIALPVCLR